MEEIFKDVKGYDGIYQVSNKGNLRKIFTYSDGTKVIKRKLPVEGSCSYRVVFVDSKKGYPKKNLSLAQVVLETFGFPQPEGTEDHFYVAGYKDGDWYNLDLDNLHWKRRNRRIKKVKKDEVA